MLCLPCVRMQMCRTFVRGQSTLTVLLFKRTSELRVLHKFTRPCTTTSNEQAAKEKVYIGDLTNQMKAVKIFSLLTSASGLLAQPFLIKQASEVGSAALVVAAYGFVGFFTFVTPVLLHWVTKKYVTELVYDSKTGEYTALTISFFLRKNYITFTPNDVKIPDVSGMFTTFIAKDIPLFVEPSTFTDVSHYGRIMGYDKPLDFKLRSISNQGDKK